MSYIQDIRALVGHRPLILVGVLVMIFDEEGRLLLQRRVDEGKWDLPGGYMELGETTEETARREILEETGLVIGEMNLFEVFSGEEYFYVCPNGDQVNPVMPVYVTRDVSGTLKADGEESLEVTNFFPDDLPDGIYTECRRIIESYLNHD